MSDPLINKIAKQFLKVSMLKNLEVDTIVTATFGDGESFKFKSYDSTTFDVNVEDEKGRNWCFSADSITFDSFRVAIKLLDEDDLNKFNYSRK